MHTRTCTFLAPHAGGGAAEHEGRCTHTHYTCNMHMHPHMHGLQVEVRPSADAEWSTIRWLLVKEEFIAREGEDAGDEEVHIHTGIYIPSYLYRRARL